MYILDSDHLTAADLADDIQDARRKYIEKQNHFIGLSVSFSDRVEQWQKMPRKSSKVGKEAVSVYNHSTTKGYHCIQFKIQHLLICY